MVLDPLGIPLGRFFWKAKGTQERDNQAVAPSRHVGQTASGFGQEDRSVRAVLDQTIALQRDTVLATVACEIPRRLPISTARAAPWAAIRSAISST